MSMKDLLSKMTELSAKVTNTDKKVITESTSVTDYNPKSQGGTRKELLAKYANSKNPKDAEAARKAGASQTELKTAKDKVVENTKPSLKNMFNSLLAEAEQVTIQPAQQNTQVIKQGDKTLGTVTNPNLAQQIKQSIGKGEMSLAGDDELQEDDLDEARNKMAISVKIEKVTDAVKQAIKNKTLVLDEDLQDYGQYYLMTKYAPEIIKAINDSDISLDLYDLSRPQIRGLIKHGVVNDVVDTNSGMGVALYDLMDTNESKQQAAGNDELQEDDVAEGLDSEQKQRLNDLIDAYRDATDPDAYEYVDPDDIVDQIRHQFGDKIADTISRGPSMHYPRPGHGSGRPDPLADRRSARVTKSGKINKQDAEFMKRNIKQQLGRMNEPKLNEEDVDNIVGYYVMSGIKGDKNSQSIGWTKDKEKADKMAKQINMRGGQSAYVQPDTKKQPATALVKDRKTGKMYNPDEEFNKLFGLNETKLNEKAKSKSQQQAAGAALAAKRGDAPKSKLKGASKEMAKMPAKELEKFAKTKHKGLPEKKEKTDEGIMDLFKKKQPVKWLSDNEADVTINGKKYGVEISGMHDVWISDLTGEYDEVPGRIRKEVHALLKAHPRSKANEAAMPTHDGDFGAGLGAGRNKTTLESSSMRLVKKDEQGNKSYKIYKDLEWGEYRVKFYENGKHLVDADHHTDDMQDAISTAQRHFKMNESKKAKPDFLDLDKDGNKKESMKKAAADKQKVSTMKKTNEAKAKPDFLDLDKDGNKKEPMKKAAADAKKKKAVKEGANPSEAARLLGKAHALAKDTFSCKYEQGSSEAQAYLDGYKEGLDECYGSGSMDDSGMNQMPTMMPGMDSMTMGQDSSNGFDDFEEDLLVGDTTFDTGSDYEDEETMMAFEAWDRELNSLLNEGKMKDIDTDMQELSDAAFKKAHGKTKAEMKKALSVDTNKTDKKTVKEGMTVSISKGQQGVPDTVSVSAQDGEADQLLALIKNAGLGLFGGDDNTQVSGYGAPMQADQLPMTVDQGDQSPEVTSTEVDMDDPTSMMSLLKKMSGGEADTSHDYEDEHGCDTCGSTSCECDTETVIGEEETEDQMEFKVAEEADSEEAETTADEDAEAEEDKALAGADSGNEEEIDESEEELNEWANDAGKMGTETTFEQDIDFMTKVISGGLNKQKQDQTTLPHTRVKVDESVLSDWKKLSGLK
jgi:hypothetical protein